MANNKMCCLILLFCAGCLSVLTARAQGLLFDSLEDDRVLLKADYLSRDYLGLPKTISLKRFCPRSNNQGDYQTCVGWSTAWTARTILEALKNNWTDTELITQNSFAPSFTYTDSASFTLAQQLCMKGTTLAEGLARMRDLGVPKYKDFSSDCPDDLPNQRVLEQAKAYKIKDFIRLCEKNSADYIKIQNIKKALAESTPVLIGIKTPQSFKEVQECWLPDESVAQTVASGHALCIIGYNDNSPYGGVFEVQNSWGEAWGNKGFAYIRYQDLPKWLLCAYQMIPEKTALIESEVDMQGSLFLQKRENAENLSVTRLKTDDMLRYKTDKPLYSRERYRIHLSNAFPAYVYVFAVDKLGNANLLFPQQDRKVSALLTGQDDHIVLPSERHWITLDDNIGTDYLCIIYSKNSIDFREILIELSRPNKSPIDLLRYVLQSQIVPHAAMQIEPDKISFKAASGLQSVVPIIVEMEHR